MPYSKRNTIYKLWLIPIALIMIAWFSKEGLALPHGVGPELRDFNCAHHPDEPEC